MYYYSANDLYQGLLECFDSLGTKKIKHEDI